MSAAIIDQSDEGHKVLTISLKEHFDYRSIHEFRTLCPSKMDCWVEVVIDMSKTRYMDSSGIALLLCLKKWINAPHVTLRVIHCNSEIRHILELSHCEDKITID